MIIDKTRQDKTRQDKTRQDRNNSLYNSCQARFLGSLYGRGTSFAGALWDKNCLSPTLTTMQGGGREPMIIDNVKECKVIGGLGENKSNNGTQYFQKDRVYKGDIALAQPANLPEGSYKYIVAMRGRNPMNPTDRTKGAPTEQRLVKAPEGVDNTLTTVQKDNLCLEIKQATKEGSIKCKVGGCDGEQRSQSCYRIRKLTPREVWRLMGYTDEDFNKAKNAGVSNSQLYKQAGNAIVKQVLMAIFSQMNIKGVKPWNQLLSNS